MGAQATHFFFHGGVQALVWNGHPHALSCAATTAGRLSEQMPPENHWDSSCICVAHIQRNSLSENRLHLCNHIIAQTTAAIVRESLTDACRPSSTHVLLCFQHLHPCGGPVRSKGRPPLKGVGQGSRCRRMPLVQYLSAGCFAGRAERSLECRVVRKIRFLKCFIR